MNAPLWRMRILAGLMITFFIGFGTAVAATLTKTTQADFEAAGSTRTNLDTTTTPGDMFLRKGGTPASTTSAGPAITSNGSGSHSIVRSDGKILIVNGSTANGLLTDLYDPSTNTVAAGPSFNTTIVSTGGHSIKLPDGRFLIIHAGGTATNVTSIYNNETSGTLALGPTLTANANGHSFTIKNTDGTFTIFHSNGLATTSLYSPNGVNGCVAANGCMAAGPTSTLTKVNGSFAVQNTDGTYLVVKGGGTTTEFYDPTSKTFSTAGAPALSGTAGRGAHALQKDADTILIFHAGVGAGTTGTTLYNRNAKTTSAGPTTPTSVGDGNFSIELPDGRYLIFPGNGSTANFFYTPSSNTFSTVGAPTDASAGLGGHAVHLPDKVSGASYANAGKYLLVRGASTTTRIYDAGWSVTGTYESEALSPAGISAWTTLSWTAGADPTLTFEVRTATTSAGLASATYRTQTNSGSIGAGAGEIWLQIRANYSRVIPKRPLEGEDVERGIAVTVFQRTFAQPSVLDVTANYNTLTLVKQVWEVGGSAPLALTNGSPATATVPSGQTIVFLIYVKNTTASALTDIRFSDLLDISASGFDYVVGSLVRTSAATPPADTASDLTIFNATAPGTGTALTDAVDGDVASACDSTAGACPGTTLNRVTVGNTTGLTPAQANGTLSIAANTAFAVRFRAVKK